MRNVKRHMPVDPPLAEYRPQPAPAIGAADANLAAAVQNSLNVHQHLPRIENVLQDIRKHSGIETVCRVKFAQRASMDTEPSLTRFRSCCFAEFEAFGLESIAGIDPEVAPLVAADIEQPAGAPQKMKRDVTIDVGLNEAQKPKINPLPLPGIESILHAAKNVAGAG